MPSQITKPIIRDYISCVVLHHAPKFANAAAVIMAKQWDHKQGEIERNIKTMTEESYDCLPCHLALILNTDESKPDVIGNHTKDYVKEDEGESLGNVSGSSAEIVVGHVKLMKVDGRSDGSCSVSYSLVVAEDYRGLGLGRILTEEAENYTRSLNMSYMYLATNDKVMTSLLAASSEQIPFYCFL